MGSKHDEPERVNPKVSWGCALANTSMSVSTNEWGLRMTKARGREPAWILTSESGRQRPRSSRSGGERESEMLRLRMSQSACEGPCVHQSAREHACIWFSLTSGAPAGIPSLPLLKHAGKILEGAAQ